MDNSIEYNNSGFLESKKTILFKKNEIIYEKGQKLDCIYIVLNGLISSVLSENKNFKEDVILKKGSSLGLMDLLLNRNYSKYMIAKTTSVLAVIKKEVILNVFDPSDYKSILLKSLAIDVDGKAPNTWS